MESISSRKEDNFVILHGRQKETAPEEKPNPWEPIQLYGPGNGIFLAIVDGLVGMHGGDIASRKVAEKFLADWEFLQENSPFSIPAIAIKKANDYLRELNSKNSKVKNMGAVCTTCYIGLGKAAISQVGDVSLFHFGKQGLKEITVDQTIMAKKIESGEITKEEARKHNQRNIVTQALGPLPVLKPVNHEFEIEVGDKILLCTAEICMTVEPSEMSQTLSTQSGDACVDALMAAASRKNPKSDLIVLLVEIQN